MGMEPTTDAPKRVHHGRNVKRLREIVGMKQETLAKQLGPDWSQRRVSGLEDREVIEAALLEQVAIALNVPPDMIRNFSEDVAIYNVIQHNYEGSKTNNAPYYQLNNQCTFNPLDKYIEAIDRNDQLIAKLEKLYEALLQSEREKNILLERLLNK